MMYSFAQVLLLGLSIQTAARVLAVSPGEIYGPCGGVHGSCRGNELYCYGESGDGTCQKCHADTCQNIREVWIVCQNSVACRGTYKVNKIHIQ